MGWRPWLEVLELEVAKQGFDPCVRGAVLVSSTRPLPGGKRRAEPVCLSSAQAGSNPMGL